MSPPFTHANTNASNPDRTHAVLGTDTEGAIHHLLEHEARVLTIQPETGKIEYAFDLDAEDLDRDVAAWIEHVGDKRGWISGTRKYVCVSAFVEHMAEATQSKSPSGGSA